MSVLLVLGPMSASASRSPSGLADRPRGASGIGPLNCCPLWRGINMAFTSFQIDPVDVSSSGDDDASLFGVTFPVTQPQVRAAVILGLEGAHHPWQSLCLWNHHRLILKVPDIDAKHNSNFTLKGC